jgi:quercetin dioxygenase-like cupin family protein
MTREEFEAALNRDGFQEIVEGRMQPDQSRSPHQHPWETRALMLSGAFHLGCDGDEVVYRPGEIFTMAAGREHTEATGPEGAVFLAGRKR